MVDSGAGIGVISFNLSLVRRREHRIANVLTRKNLYERANSKTPSRVMPPYILYSRG